jgi:hypothetical protein
MASNNKDKIAETIISIINNTVQPAIKQAKIVLGASKGIINELEPLAEDVAEIIVKLDNITKEIPKRLEVNKRKYELNKSIQDNIHNQEIELLEKSDVIYSAAKQKADSLTRGIMPFPPSPTPPSTTSSTPVTPINNRGFVGGSSLKQIQKGGKKTLTRTTKSINDFLNSSITSSYILNMVKKGGKTKRRLLNKYNKTKRLY